MPDAVLHLPWLDEFDTNDEQNVLAEDVCDNAFTFSNFALAPLRATLSSLVMNAQTLMTAEYKAYPDFNPRFEECPVLVFVPLAVDHEIVIAKFLLNDWF